MRHHHPANLRRLGKSHGGQQLPPRDNAVLPGRDEPNRSKFSSLSDGNPDWFAHAAMVGARAAPTQHPICNNSAQKPTRLSAPQQHDAPRERVVAQQLDDRVS